MAKPSIDDADDLDPVDRIALQRAIEMARQESAARRRQIDDKLQDEPWIEVAEFAAYSCQTSSLKLKPWETAPVSVSLDSRLRPQDPGDLHGIRPAVELLRRLLDAGLSRYEPDPVGALERLERQTSNGQTQDG